MELYSCNVFSDIYNVLDDYFDYILLHHKIFFFQKVLWVSDIVKPKLNDSIPYVIVAAGFSLRFASSDGCSCIPRKLRNLKDAATQIAQFR